MKESQPLNHQHLEALHYLINVPFRESLGVRANKELVLERLGFSKGTNVSIKKEFSLPEHGGKKYDIREYIAEQLNDGRFVSMLFKDGRWEAMGGSPVIYIMTQEDLDAKLVFEQDKLIQTKVHDGSLVNVDHQIVLQTYARKRSIPSELSGFVNYSGQIPVRLGGGFRLQVDDLQFIDGQPRLALSGYFSFNDMGSRVLALSCEKDCLVPRCETSFSLKVDNGQLIFPDSRGSNNETLISTNEAGVVVNQVLSSLFKRDGKAISDLLRGVLSVRPSMKVHQLEGIFSIPSKTEISAEVIDFDGIDSFDIDGQEPSLSPAERLVQSQLSSVDYLLTKPEDLLSYISFKNKVRDIVRGLVDSTDLKEDIKREISRHVTNSSDIFSREFTGVAKLGRLLNSLDIDWIDTGNPHVRSFQNGDSVITAISIEGYHLAFWMRASTLVDCSDIKALSSELSHITEKEILPVHLSSLREGD